MDTVEYELTNEERFVEALESEAACKDFTNTLIEQTAENIELRLEEKIPQLICNDDNFVAYDDTTKKGNLYEEDEDFWKDPIKILQALFNGSSILKKKHHVVQFGPYITPGNEELVRNWGIMIWQNWIEIDDMKFFIIRCITWKFFIA